MTSRHISNQVWTYTPYLLKCSDFETKNREQGAKESNLGSRRFWALYQTISHNSWEVMSEKTREVPTQPMLIFWSLKVLISLVFLVPCSLLPVLFQPHPTGSLKKTCRVSEMKEEVSGTLIGQSILGHRNVTSSPERQQDNFGKMFSFGDLLIAEIQTRPWKEIT